MVDPILDFLPDMWRLKRNIEAKLFPCLSASSFLEFANDTNEIEPLQQHIRAFVLGIKWSAYEALPRIWFYLFLEVCDHLVATVMRHADTVDFALTRQNIILTINF